MHPYKSDQSVDIDRIGMTKPRELGWGDVCMVSPSAVTAPVKQVGGSVWYRSSTPLLLVLCAKSHCAVPYWLSIYVSYVRLATSIAICRAGFLSARNVLHEA